MTNEYGLQALQKELLTILIDIDRVCRDSNIKYSLSDGTLLGAVRERGFIPWDDDVDICFTRAEYEKFLEVYPTKKDDNLIIDSVFNKCCLAVMSSNKAVLKENKYNIPGPWVTLFVFDNAPNGRLKQRAKVFLCKLLMGMAGKPIHYKDFGKKTKILFSITSLIGIFFPLKTIRRLHLNISKWANKKDSKFVSIYNTFDGCINILHSKNILEDYQNIEFEGEKLMCMNGKEAYLKNLYGDYMTPPPENERSYKHL